MFKFKNKKSKYEELVENNEEIEVIKKQNNSNAEITKDSTKDISSLINDIENETKAVLKTHLNLMTLSGKVLLLL